MLIWSRISLSQSPSGSLLSQHINCSEKDNTNRINETLALTDHFYRLSGQVFSQMGIQATFGLPFSIKNNLIFHMLLCKYSCSIEQALKCVLDNHFSSSGYQYKPVSRATYKIQCILTFGKFNSLYCACRSSPLTTASGHQQDAELCVCTASRFVLTDCRLVDSLVLDGYKVSKVHV